uniref:Uncharacterized protein n=1 Tax=Anguilla anguilla TaxID=7936 RepID=A0A0E9VAR9_ANGAN
MNKYKHYISPTVALPKTTFFFTKLTVFKHF